MTAALGIAVSGLNAARVQLAASASNIANQRTSGPLSGPRPGAGYQPVEAVNSSLASGGVQAELQPVNPAVIAAFEPDSPFANEEGIVGAPNISLAEQLVNAQTAVRQFEANAAVIRTVDEINQTLIDRLA